MADAHKLPTPQNAARKGMSLGVLSVPLSEPARGRTRRQNAVSWSRRLPRSIGLSDGRALETLADARDFILALRQRRQNNDWQHASELLMKGARGGATEIDVAWAADQLKVALHGEGLI